MKQPEPHDRLSKLIFTPIIKTFGIRYLVAGPGRVEAEITPDARFGNHAGNLQGGVVAVYLDNIMGQACYTLLPEGQRLSTIDMSLSFLEPMPLGRLRVQARVVKKGRRVIFAESELQDLEGKPLARASASLLVLHPRQESALPVTA